MLPLDPHAESVAAETRAVPDSAPPSFLVNALAHPLETGLYASAELEGAEMMAALHFRGRRTRPAPVTEKTANEKWLYDTVKAIKERSRRRHE